MSVTLDRSADTTTIRPFTFEVSDAELDDLRARVAATRWPERETVEVDSQGPQLATQGVPLATVQALAKYWETEYDWRRFEATLNSVPHFITEIDGLDIHFIHVRSKHEGALPMLASHGWPGSFIELMKLIEPLTNPTAHGASAADAFDLVIPSMPGYGFSGKPAEAGWGPERIARAWAELMSRLGYTRYVASGGDWGGLIVDMMGAQQAPGLIGIHTNFPGCVPVEVDQAAATGTPPPPGLTAEEQQCYDRIAFFYAHGLSYALEMIHRPQTLYGIADSPVGLAGWMFDHDNRSLELIGRMFAGQPEGLTPDDLLDNITLYWLTNTAVSASRLYWENKLPFWTPKGVTVPVAVSVYPDEIYTPSRAWAEQGYPNLVHYNRLTKGGHFAAWEQPESFCDEVRTGLRSLR